MTVNEVLHFVDELVYEKTGKRLNDLQKTVVEGTWQRQTYDEIAQKCNVSKNHVSDVGYQLWELLSEHLGEDIKKRSFCSTIERLKAKSSQININNIQNSRDLNFYSDRYPKNEANDKTAHHDLKLAPKIIHFYNRETEIKTLSDWILTQNTRLISVLGLQGIGKTTLIRKFVDLNLEEFEIIIWKNFKFSKSLNLLLDDILSFDDRQAKEITDDKLRQLLNLITEKKCLIILDDVHNLFISGQFAGQYQSEYRDYNKLFKTIAEAEHHSHFILITQEECSEIHCLDEEAYPVKCLELSGMDNVEFFRNRNLQDEESWQKLIQLYEGNLGYLQDIAILIKDVFNGKVAEFLAENNLVISSNMQNYFQELFDRLSPVEQQLVKEFSKLDRPVSRIYLNQKLNLSSTDFINALQSLQKRYLVKTINGEKSLFNLSSVFKQYIAIENQL
jgi:hypothetical protein